MTNLSFNFPVFPEGITLPSFRVTYLCNGGKTLFAFHVQGDGALTSEQLTPWDDAPDMEILGIQVEATWPETPAQLRFEFEIYRTENILHHGILETILLKVAAGQPPFAAYNDAMLGREDLWPGLPEL